MLPYVLAIVAAIAPAAASVRAHHSIGAVYDDNRPITVAGVISRFQFVDPHPFVRIEVKDRSGKAQLWVLEMEGRGELAGMGFGPDTLKPGDRIVVTGIRARAQPRVLYIRRLDRPADGFSYEPHQ
jgi:hypothetical protein